MQSPSGCGGEIQGVQESYSLEEAAVIELGLAWPDAVVPFPKCG